MRKRFIMLQPKLWLTPAELNEEFDIKISTQAKLRMESNPSKIPFSKIGKQIRYNRERIHTWLDSLAVQ